LNAATANTTKLSNMHRLDEAWIVLDEDGDVIPFADAKGKQPIGDTVGSLFQSRIRDALNAVDQCLLLRPHSQRQIEDRSKIQARSPRLLFNARGIHPSVWTVPTNSNVSNMIPPNEAGFTQFALRRSGRKRPAGVPGGNS